MQAMKAKTTDQTTLLRDRCLGHFLALRIPIEAAALDELLARTEKESFSHLSFLDRLLGAEASARRERAVARRIRDTFEATPFPPELGAEIARAYERFAKDHRVRFSAVRSSAERVRPLARADPAAAQGVPALRIA